MNFSTSKYMGLILILSINLFFNYFFFTFIKERTDSLYTKHVIPFISVEAQNDVKQILKKPAYSRNDLDNLANISFNSYKENLRGRIFLSDTIKNISLINLKTVIYDNNSFYFGLKYIFNIVAIMSFAFIFIYKDKINGVRYEPTLHS
jgi:hypothetical protein